jgi:predicted PurR-regulated permease PerM
MRNIPTPFHLSAMWTAIAALSITVILAITIGFIYLSTQIISFLQPLLIPFAVAAVLAYLLEPVVAWLVRVGLNRQRAVLLVFSVATAIFIGILLLIVPTLIRQAGEFGHEFARQGGYAEKAKERVSQLATEWHAKIKTDYGIELLDFIGGPKKDEAVASSSEGALGQGAASSEVQTEGESKPKTKVAEQSFDLNDLLTGAWLKTAVTNLVPATWSLTQRSLGGFLGVFGFLLSFVIVPLYLYYFLTESATITQRWSDYVPLRASQFKDEVVGTLTEINGYLIAFFRGQLVVSLINGVATGLGLVIVGLKFGWLIGLSLCLLGIIPYLGIVLCWIPAVIIASVQGGDGTWITGDPWWVFPLVVTGIFAVVQQIDGLYITPKIVGESVGLHPMTVIMSVFLWSLIMGGLLGAILAVPMTASFKVLFQRYVWEKRFRPELLNEHEPA